jgi:superfamily II DNA or RNA helicase
MPTGAGKTRFAAEIVSGALAKGNTVAFTVPAISLIDQTVESFAMEGIDSIGVMQGSHERTDLTQPVQVCSLQTLSRRGCPDTDVVIVDECHLRFKVLSEWMAKRPKTTFVGLSATPWARGMAEDWQDLVVPVRMQELIDREFLSPFRVYAPSHPDLSGVKTLAGDYHEGQLAEVMGEKRLVADIVETWLKLARWQPTLVFAVDRAHAKKLQAEFASAGVPMGYCDANTDRIERAVLFGQMARGEIAGICNVGTLTTGVDADVRCVVLARPTKSEMLHVQIIGRALRTAPGKSEALILDHADNHARLGFVTDIHHDRLLSGKDKPPQTRKEQGEAMPKECPSCGTLKAPKVRECPSCGFTPTRQSDIETEDGELEEITKSPAKPKATMEEKQKFWSMACWLDDERMKGGKLAKALYKSKYGVWPRGLSDRPTQPDVWFMSYEKSRRIAFAKSRGAAR